MFYSLKKLRRVRSVQGRPKVNHLLKSKLYYRGARIWQAIMDELQAKGMKNAANALLLGCSAGGLASIIYCDKFCGLLPWSAKVKCFSDAAECFPDMTDVQCLHRWQKVLDPELVKGLWTKKGFQTLDILL